MILLDTCIIIDYLRNRQHAIDFIEKIGKHNLALSRVAAIELFKGVRDKKEYRILQTEIQQFGLIEMDRPVSLLAGKLAETFALSHKMAVADTLIAATALVFDLELKTYNLKDFQFIPTLKVSSDLG